VAARGPLDGVRVIELGGIGPGPHAAMVLADLGADVVRVRRPGGLTMPAEHLDLLHRGKRIVDLDVKTDPQALLELVAKADVLLDCFRPGTCERLGIGQAAGQYVRVIGYPQGSNVPIRCGNLARSFGPTQLVFDCGRYTDGTSGGPLLEDVNPTTGLGTVIGVIGGYQQGGDTPSVSYSARFGALVADLYKTAVGQ